MEKVNLKQEDYLEWIDRLGHIDPMVWTFFYQVEDISEYHARRMGFTLGVIESWYDDSAMIVIQGT